MTYSTIPNILMFINWETNVSDDYILRITDGGTAASGSKQQCIYYKSTCIYITENSLKHRNIIY
jgi:hypothetical protein